MATQKFDGAKKVAAAARDGAKVAIDATGEFAKKTAKTIDEKSREILEKEFAAKRPAATATLERLRAALPTATPSEIVAALSEEFQRNEKGVSSKSDKFLSAATHYVLTLNEIYGAKVRDDGQRQVMLYLLLAANSNTARVIAQVGAMAFAMLNKRFRAVAAVASLLEVVKKYGGKVTWVATFATLAGIDNPARKSAGWIVVTGARRILGEPPAKWPATQKSAAAKTATKKPSAK